MKLISKMDEMKKEIENTYDFQEVMADINKITET